MPTYEYQCKSCGHTFDAYQPISAKPLKKCPQCGKGVKRLIGSGSGIIFKGSGFYETDYKKKTPPPKEKKSEPSISKKDKASTETGGKTEKKTEKKSENKSDSSKKD